ncbi:unannotated protein [freshwater metagenome]|uniref:Unannotated protein n=1 Tax=freshwater metagenome TaxID=449393 RepID=A0A6J6ZPQ2_9ZZZZ
MSPGPSEGSTGGGVDAAAPQSESASSIPSGTTPSNTSTARTFGVDGAIRANSEAYSASVYTTSASQ